MGILSLLELAHRANGVTIPSGQPTYPSLVFNKFGKSDTSSLSDYQSLFSINPDVYRAVAVINNNIAMLPFKVTVPGKDGLSDDITNDSAFDIFKTFNDRDTAFDFWEQTVGNLELCGEVFWLKNFDPSGKIIQMAVLRPDMLTIVPDNEFIVKHYIFKRGGEEIIIPKEFIFHMKYFNPSDNLRGLSPLAAASRDVVLDLYALNASKSTFQKGARPSGVITPKGDEVMDAAEVERNVQFIRDAYSGQDNFGKIMMLTQGMEWHSLQYSNKDLQYDIIRNATSDVVSKVYGVPHIFMMNFKEASKLSNADVQYKLLWESLKPKCIKISQIITEHLLPEIADIPGAVFEFDLKNVSALQPDRLKLKTLFLEGGKVGAASPNDYREHVLNLERVDDPAMDQFYMPFNVAPIGTSKLEPVKSILEKQVKQIASAIDVRVLGDEKSVVKQLNKGIELFNINKDKTEQQLYYIRVFGELGKIQNKVTKEFQKKLEKLFKAQGKEVIKNLMNQKYFKYAEGDELFDFDEWAKKYEAEGKVAIAEAIRLAGEHMAKELGTEFNVFDPDVVNHIGTKSKQYAKIVNKTTKKKIDAILKKGVENGLSVNELAAEISSYFDSAESYRAARIARTEVASATNKGRLESMLQSKKVKKHRWITMRDAAVRENHQIDGETVKLNDQFSNGFVYPNDINERCTTFPVKVKT